MTQAADLQLSVLLDAVRGLPDDQAEAVRAHLLQAAEQSPAAAPQQDIKVAAWLSLVLSAVTR